MNVCKCGSKLDFEQCCGKFISEKEFPSTAEELMRSRYTAYAINNIDYIVKTTQPKYQDAVNIDATKDWAENSEWIELKIHEVKEGKKEDTEGFVNFTAVFKYNNNLEEHKETSYFVKEDGKWYFAPENKKPLRVEKVGRNEPCPCGSGKKYKKCCGK